MSRYAMGRAQIPRRFFGGFLSLAAIIWYRTKMEDLDLLREYAERRSERAFTELVNRHVNLVFSTALRVVGQNQLAEDVAQLVVAQLARKPGSLRQRTGLT